MEILNFMTICFWGAFAVKCGWWLAEQYIYVQSVFWDWVIEKIWNREK